MSIRIAELARLMYEDMPTPKPSWDQLGDTTRQVWYERAVQALRGDPATLPLPPSDAEPLGGMHGLHGPV